MSIGETLTHTARHNGAGLALVVGSRRVDWRALNEGANRFANALLKLGAVPGDRVVMFLENSVEFVEVYYGLAKIGCISAPVLARSVASEIGYVVKDLGARFLVIEAASAHLLDEIRDELKSVEAVICVGDGHGLARDYAAITAEASADEPGVPVAPADDLTVKYTSGTTGEPKGCLRTHDNFLWAAAIGLIEEQFEDDDIASITSPLAAGMAISELVRNVIRGIPSVMMDKFDPAAYLALIEREGITVGYAMDNMFRRLALHPELNDYDLSSLRIFGEGRPPEAVARLWGQKTFRARPSVAGYGASEAGGRITFRKPAEMDPVKFPHRQGSLGRAGRLIQIGVVDDDFNPVPVGEIGEFVVKSPTVFKGYWERGQETAKVFRDGWLLTGDLATMDADGFLFLQGRKRDMIKTGGINVYPAEIETVMAAFANIEQVAVVGIPDAQWGEKVIACVVAEAGVTEGEILETCAARLAGFKKPKSILFLDALPINETGKVMKKDLREWVMAREAVRGGEGG